MKFLLVAVACLAITANAYTVVFETEEATHTDEWCAKHHLGEGPTSCVSNPGCCYDYKADSCHSCDAHSDEWCTEHGVNDAGVQNVADCISYAGCTYDSNLDQCISSTEELSNVITCSEARNNAEINGAEVDADLELVGYVPICDVDGLWEPEQHDLEGTFFCADKDGHEIPDTRRHGDLENTNNQEAANTGYFFDIDCGKARDKYDGWQCPNAVTLTTGDGEVVINDHSDVGNCQVSCNTDLDCQEEEWCCFNGCGYSCHAPIRPHADCNHLVLDESLQVIADEEMARGHGAEVTVACAEGFSGENSITATCEHGEWSEIDMQCLADCPLIYEVPEGFRQRDYLIGGKGAEHGSTRRIRCITGYGIVDGSLDAMKDGEETLECRNGAWDLQTLECSFCYDAQEHEWRDNGVDAEGNTQGNDCAYYAARPLECVSNPEAKDNCRKACRTCDEAEELYLVRNRVTSVKSVNHRSSWVRKIFDHKTKIQKYKNEIQVTKVPKYKKKESGDSI